MSTIRIDDELRHNADKMFDEVGMNTNGFIVFRG